MIRNIALIQLFGLPIVVYGGIATLSSFAFTAYIGYTNKSGKGTISYRWHPRMVIVSFILAVIHATFALSLFLNF
jgi:NO-binding membrane sensor protein with MHYT domain